jgi:hypothetical protein
LTAVGVGSLQNNTTGDNSTAVGVGALFGNATGSNLVGFGVGAGRFIADGVTDLTASSNSCFIGASTKGTQNATNENVFGFNATGNGSNTMSFGNSNITNTYLRGVISTNSTTTSTSTTTGAICAASLGITGAIFAGSLNGNGSGLTSLNASNISTGTLSAARLPDTYLPLAGGTVTGATNFSLGLSVRSQGFAPLQLINLGKTEAGLSTSYAFYNMKSTDAGGLGLDCFSIYTYTNGNVKSVPFVILDNDNVGIGTTSPSQKLDVNGSAKATSFVVGISQVVSARRTGWAAPTGTATRTTFATSTITLPQLAERVKALIDDLTTHGLIGA